MFEAEAKLMFWLLLGPILLGLLTVIIAPHFIRSYAEARATASAAHRTPTATPISN